VCASLLNQEPLCRYCKAVGQIVAATVVDHKLALSLGGSNDPSNLVPACKGCNDGKSVDERRFVAKGYDIADVMLEPALAEWFRLARSFEI
jgi:5-methylcytosine-specific restriction protein A